MSDQPALQTLRELLAWAEVQAERNPTDEPSVAPIIARCQLPVLKVGVELAEAILRDLTELREAMLTSEGCGDGMCGPDQTAIDRLTAIIAKHQGEQA